MTATQQPQNGEKDLLSLMYLFSIIDDDIDLDDAPCMAQALLAARRGYV